MKKRGLFVVASIIVIFIAYNIYDEHREKALDELIGFSPTNFHMMEFNYDSHLRVEDRMKAEELMDFLSQYSVKKMKSSDWDTDVSNEDGFYLVVYGENPSVIGIFEKRLIADDAYYELVNGPIDMEWVEGYMSEIH